MKRIILMLLLTTGGSMGFLNHLKFLNHCDIKKCESLMPEEPFMSLTGLPTAEQLNEMCPPFLEVVKCFTDEVVSCTGQTLEELAEVDNETISRPANLFSSLVKISYDLCNEETQLHKDYVANSDCLGEIFLSPHFECLDQAHRLYKIYRESIDGEEERGIFISDEVRAESHCMKAAYEMACFLAKTQKSCGDTAKDFFLEIVKRTKYLKVSLCGKEDFKTLKSNFIDFLVEQGEKRDFLESAFDFKRRK